MTLIVLVKLPLNYVFSFVNVSIRTSVILFLIRYSYLKF